MTVSARFFNLAFASVSKRDYRVGCRLVSLLINLFRLELLRKTSEHVLIDMVQLLFARLPQFKDDATSSTLTKRVGGEHDGSPSQDLLFV